MRTVVSMILKHRNEIAGTRLNAKTAGFLVVDRIFQPYQLAAVFGHATTTILEYNSKRHYALVMWYGKKHSCMHGSRDVNGASAFKVKLTPKLFWCDSKDSLLFLCQGSIPPPSACRPQGALRTSP